MGDQTSNLADILHDQSFRELLRLSQREALTWDTFLTYPLPSGMSPLAVWNLLGSIGSCIGVHLFYDENERLLWYRRTCELSVLANQIAQRSAKDSLLHKALLDHADRSFVVGLRLAEGIAASKLAGIDADADRLEMHVRTGTRPELPSERLIANAISLDADLSSLVDEPFSESLLDVFHRRLIEGIDLEGQQALAAKTGGEVVDEQAWRLVHSQLERVIEYANWPIDNEDSDVLRGNFLGDVIRYHRPFGFTSSQVASLASRLFYLKHDLPVLSLVPVSHAKHRWAEAELDGRMLCNPVEYESTRRRCICDITVHHTLSAQCIDLVLDELESCILGCSAKNDTMRALLASDQRFNHRQRSILARALRTPCAEFHIRYHQEKNRISYTTARRDLAELAEAGYLRAEQRGKAFVFVVDKGVEALEARIS